MFLMVFKVILITHNLIFLHPGISIFKIQSTSNSVVFWNGLFQFYRISTSLLLLKEALFSPDEFDFIRTRCLLIK